jgi:hypothetical protein
VGQGDNGARSGHRIIFVCKLRLQEAPADSTLGIRVSSGGDWKST